MDDVNTFRWYAIYTKPRWEKKVHALCQQKNIISYCPVQLSERQWADRKKKIELPLFPSYLFVNITEAQQTQVKMIDGVVNFVYWLGKPAQIKNEEINTIKSFLETYDEVEIVNTNLAEGDTVKIKQGLLVNHTATVQHIFGNKAMVYINQLGIGLKATLEKKKLQKINL